VILPSEIKELMGYGITRIYSPDDGRELGLQGMINDMVEKADFPTMDLNLPEGKDVYQSLEDKDITTIARLISLAENREEDFLKIFDFDKVKDKNAPVVGITGTGGAGKSSRVDELVRRFLIDFPEKTISLISVDPSKRSEEHTSELQSRQKLV